MAEQIIKDSYFRILGYIETKPNGDKIGKDSYRRIVGYYEAKTNVTKDFYQRIVAHKFFGRRSKFQEQVDFDETPSSRSR